LTQRSRIVLHREIWNAYTRFVEMAPGIGEADRGEETGIMKRSSPVRVRLVPATEGAPIEVVFSDDERAEVEQVSGDLGISTFIRNLGVFAAQDEPGQTPAELIQAGAASAGMRVGEWLRIVTLAAIGYSDLAKHIEHARASLEKHVENAKGAVPSVPVPEQTLIRPSARRIR
jgi:mRNA-degrading endonuclease toxin of MazEF toxin-antitoxin module